MHNQLIWVSVNKGRASVKAVAWVITAAFLSRRVDQIAINLREEDDEESAIENNNNFNETPPQWKPVSNEDRHITCDATHTAESESTKQNADKAVSCNPTATDERSRQQDFDQQSRESSEKNSFAGQFDGAECQILIETESWRTAKNWKSDSRSSEIRTSQGNCFSHGLPSFFFRWFRSNVLHTCSVLFLCAFSCFGYSRPRSWFKNLFSSSLLHRKKSLTIKANNCGGGDSLIDVGQSHLASGWIALTSSPLICVIISLSGSLF